MSNKMSIRTVNFTPPPPRFHYSSDGEPNKYSGYVYDAVWLYAIALGKTAQSHCYRVQWSAELGARQFCNVATTYLGFCDALKSKKCSSLGIIKR